MGLQKYSKEKRNFRTFEMMKKMLKIATLNIDWAKKYKLKNYFLKIEKKLNTFQNFPKFEK